MDLIYSGVCVLDGWNRVMKIYYISMEDLCVLNGDGLDINFIHLFDSTERRGFSTLLTEGLGAISLCSLCEWTERKRQGDRDRRILCNMIPTDP